MDELIANSMSDDDEDEAVVHVCMAVALVHVHDVLGQVDSRPR